MDLLPITEKDRVVLVTGAGASINEMSRHGYIVPPTDQNFLEIAEKCHAGHFRKLRKSFNEVWAGCPPYPMKQQRMEQLFASAYLQVQQTKGSSIEGMAAVELYDQLIVLLRDTLSTTTNLGVPQEHVDLIAKIKARSPEKFSMVTFNYDLLADRALRELDRDGKLIWSHRDGYGFKPANEWLPNPRSDTKLYKLHGSLNWYIEAPSKRREAAFNPSAPIHVPKPGPSKTAPTWQRRQRVLGHTSKKAFPLMIPPIFDKGVQIQGKIGAVWREAQADLENATIVIVWGYSLPVTDYHADYLFARAARRAGFRLIAINPDPTALSRVTYVCGHKWSRWFFRVGHFFRWMDGRK